MTNADKVIDHLRNQNPGSGLCDDCLAVTVDVHPRQQINQICRRLQSEGRIARRNGICSRGNHGREKVLNFAAETGTNVPAPSEPDEGPPALREQTHILSDWLSEGTEFLSRVENVSRSSESNAARISRLRREGLIPSSLADKMLHLNSFRNQVVKERKALDADEWKLAQKYIRDCKSAWKK
jgi:hypothetical protein